MLPRCSKTVIETRRETGSLLSALAGPTEPRKVVVGKILFMPILNVDGIFNGFSAVKFY